jgi:hypothetical protein
MTTTASLRSRLVPSALVVRLAAGDAVALTIFFTLGAISHDLRPFADPTVVAEGVAPFLLAWWLAALVGDLYTADAIVSPRRAVTATLPVWVLALLAGNGLRATELFRGGAAWTFMLVTLVVCGTLLVGWRVLAAAVLGRG